MTGTTPENSEVALSEEVVSTVIDAPFAVPFDLQSGASEAQIETAKELGSKSSVTLTDPLNQIDGEEIPSGTFVKMAGAPAEEPFGPVKTEEFRAKAMYALDFEGDASLETTVVKDHTKPTSISPMLWFQSQAPQMSGVQVSVPANPVLTSPLMSNQPAATVQPRAEVTLDQVDPRPGASLSDLPVKTVNVIPVQQEKTMVADQTLIPDRSTLSPSKSSNFPSPTGPRPSELRSSLVIGQASQPEVLLVPHQKLDEATRIQPASTQTVETAKIDPEITQRLGSLTSADLESGMPGRFVEAGLSRRGLVTPAMDGTKAIVAMPHSAATAQSIANQLSVAIQRSGDDSVEIMLDPPELGRVNLTLATVAENVTVQISADRADVGELMRRHADLLHRELLNAGFRNVEIDVGIEGNNTQHSAGQESQETDPTLASGSGNEQAEEPKSDQVGLNGLDLRL
ncbi:MAG: flagellar hook-length control protein FliK [Pseudomonadota bacterium]